MAALIMLCGRIGTGKTTYAQHLKNTMGAAVLSYDDMMLALFDDCIGFEQHQKMLVRCKQYLYQQAQQLLELGIPVVLDFGFWEKHERTQVRSHFKGLGADVQLYYMDRDGKTVQAFIARRNQAIRQQGLRAYEMDEEKLAFFGAMFQPPTADEVDVRITHVLPE